MIDVLHCRCRTGPSRRSGASAIPTQAYCDLLEVRWLLSEERATTSATMRRSQLRSTSHVIPDDSAATISFVETPTAELPEIDADLLDDSVTDR